MPFSRPIVVAFASAMFFATPALASAATADLGVTNPVITGETRPGAEITLAYTVSNAGPDATAVTVDDAPSEGTQLLSITPSQGSCTPNAGRSLCDLGVVAPGSTVAMAVKVRLGAAGNYQHVAWVRPTNADLENQTQDPNRDNDSGGINFNVEEPYVEPVEVQTPAVSMSAGFRRTQTTVGVGAELTPYGAGTLHFEYGTTKTFGKKTAAVKISGDKLERKATIRGLGMKTKIYWRAVMVVGGKTYRGKTHSETTLGKLLFPLITLKATKRTASSTTYVGTIGDGFADAPGACKGTIQMDVYTASGGDVLRRRTTVNAKTCSYKITIPFGTKDARKYGRKGKGVYVQAGFSGSKAVAATRSSAERP
ncbi:DUF11 domain-containing protein [Patulibacter americanus]|uniref:DUF11 domain-containing protein n=1 Tax=Patulibacter americanus TaxID=588672 RepID=UPI0003B60E11|nr:DUF11 domain-containing protein [Patulibacter americanus]